MKAYNYIFFDLDGTLTDSGEGIMNGFAYAVQKMGDVVEDKSQYRKFVGPPLKDSFERVLGYSPEDAQKAIAFYRKYYNEMGGNLENKVYPGIEKLLSDLKAAGKTLVIATSKQERGTKFILGHFGLDKYFDFMAASNDTDRQHKVDVIRYAIEHYGIEDLGSVVMVGDRENDVLASAEIGIDSIGVLYGYGDLKELTDAGATYIAETVEDIFRIIEK